MNEEYSAPAGSLLPGKTGARLLTPQRLIMAVFFLHAVGLRDLLHCGVERLPVGVPAPSRLRMRARHAPAFAPSPS